jgi:hypothetical protein
MALDDDRSAHLRRLIEQIDSRLLSLLTHDVHLDGEALHTISLLETARSTILRLLAAAEDRAAG